MEPSVRRESGSALRRLVVSVAGVGVLLVGCSQERPVIDAEFGRLYGHFVAKDGVYVVPDRSWRREGSIGGSFRKSASFLIYIEGAGPDGLRVEYWAEGDTERFHFNAEWDGAPIWDRARSAGADPLVVEIAASALTPGLHHLSLDREKDLDRKDDRIRGRNVFSRVDIERIDGGETIPQPIIPNNYLAGFLEFGVTSMTSTQLSGCLFYGPQRHSLELEGDSIGSATFVLQNQSSGIANFRVEIDGAQTKAIEVPARGTSSIDVRIPTGRSELTLEVEGRADGCFLWGAPHLTRKSGSRGSPVILISLDTTRRDVVAPYSVKRGLTPVLERLSRSATVFNNAYAVAPWTLPSHASIFTGMYPSHHGAGVSDDVLSRSWNSLAEIFRDSGYRTAGFAGGSMASSRFGMAQGFDAFMDPPKAQLPGNVITDAAIEFIEDHVDDPLFLFLNYFDPHAPYSAPPEFQRLADVDELATSIRDTPVWEAYARNQPGAWTTIAAGEAPTSTECLSYLRARYEAEVAFMDHQIGRLLDTLKENNLYDEALIVLVADHGEYMGERGLYSHSYRLDRELMAVPLVIKWPGQDHPQVIDALVSHIDLFPTIATAVGLDAPDSDGIAFTRKSAAGLTARQHVFMEEHKSRYHQLPGPFKIADHLFGMQWLDASEVFSFGFIECSRRLGDQWSADECRSSWEGRIEELSIGMRSTLTLDANSSIGDLDEDEAEKLRALGYLQ